MNRKWYRYFALLLLLMIGVVVAEEEQGKTDQEQLKELSKAVGHKFGKKLETIGVKIDLNRVNKGIKDGLDGKSAPLSDKEGDELIRKFRTKAIQEGS